MLKGLTALVTGSTSGIGLGIAEALASRGANVVLNGFGESAAIEAMRRKIAGDHDVAVRYDGADLSRQDAIETMIARALDEFGAIDILVNNAGIQHVAPVDEFPVDKWNAIIALNLTASFHTIRLALPAMKARRAGKIINIGSLMSRLARPTTVPYQTSKGAIAMLTRGLAVELAPFGIQVNAIGPGFFRTEMNAALTGNPEFSAWVEKRTPAGRWAAPEELAGAAVFLASPASAFVTGQILYVDGGFTAAM